MDSMIQKNLLPGWFPFGDYPMPEKDRYVSLDERDEDRRRAINEKLYGIDNCPKISVCSIVGKNGSGKSTLLDVMFRIINNIAYNFLIETGETAIKYAAGVNADLHFEVDGSIGYVRCMKEANGSRK